MFETLAIIGAAAWTYPLAVWIHQLLTKTKVEVINHRQLEIGFTTFGPMLNLNLAFSAEKRDAFIKQIQLTLTHENNEVQNFQWEWFEEILLEMDMAESGTIPYKKNQKAIAIKVPTQTLIEKKVGFQQRQFQKEYTLLYSQTNQTAINIKESGVEQNQIIATSEYNNFADLFKNFFLWKVGQYKGHLTVFVADGSSFNAHLSFVLTALDIKTLEKNINTCKEALKNHFIDLDPDFKADWRWVYREDTSK